MEKKYNHKIIETQNYKKGLDEKLFIANPQSNKPKFCIVLPPPNITGLLHLGHAGDGTIQDSLIRYKRLQGYETLFVPGIDHAGIATQVKVQEEIKKENLQLGKNLDKKTFFDYAGKGKDKYNDIIHLQGANLGLALDYSREKFSLDEDVGQAVRKVFVDLYNKNLIYQGKKIVNGDPVLKTAISNIEVDYQEVKGKLYYLKYYLADKSNPLIVATTRPETMFADQALVVNPNDKRYQKFIGLKVINPANKQLIPIISDDYVDSSFATGIMKCTPAHDFNDYQIGLKNNLAMSICLDITGKTNELAGSYAHQDRFLCRKNLIADLQKQNLVEKIEDYNHQVGYSQRTNVVVEPYLSKQGFIKMNSISEMILQKQAAKDTKINFFPAFFEDQLLKGVNNIQDGCISRQLGWGHQIPVGYHKKTKEVYVDVKAPKDIDNYTQDPDVLDTGFSSGLGPLVTLNGLNKENLEFKNFYPTSVLVTAYDILFFGVVRMIFMGFEFSCQKPFNDVLIHGLIRDQQGRKMSKSLDNGINPIDVIEEYGADALRYFLIANSSPGQDLRFSNIKVESSGNLINKLWNAARYVLLNLPADFNFAFDLNSLNDKLKFSYIDQGILEQLNQLIIKVEKNMNDYDFISVSHDLSNFIGNQYCSGYIELSKVNLQDSNLFLGSMSILVFILKQIIIMLHPFIPFVTEEIYQKMRYEKSILLEQYPKVVTYNFKNYNSKFVDSLIEIIKEIREIRNQFSLAFKVKLDLHIKTNERIFLAEKEQFNKYLLKLTNAKIVSVASFSFNKEIKTSKIISDAVIEIISDLIFDKEKELLKFQKQLAKVELEIEKSQLLLNNSQFKEKALPEKVKFQKDKLKQNQKQQSLILAKIKELS